MDFLVGGKDENIPPIYDILKNTDIGASLGVGLEGSVGLGRSMLVEFRYSPSFTDAFKSNAVTVKNQSMEFLVGVCL